jgi:phospholipase/carboxylesterase
VPGRLLAAPTASATTTGAPGLHDLRVPGGDGDALLLVPPRLATPAPFVLALHGADGNAAAGLELLRSQADRLGMIVLAPSARGRTWDLILSGFGPDVAAIDTLLTDVFASYALDPARLAIAGFSDGASYALSLGLTNGDLFSHVVAFSPGYYRTAAAPGRPPVFVSHGTADDVLPIDRTSRRLVPRLERAGYDVRYHEFEGGHTVPEAIRAEAAEWLVAPRTPARAVGRASPVRRVRPHGCGRRSAAPTRPPPGSSGG